ncbi:LOW QUALITY PROTEIN: taperin [Hippoglossus stenolepis]|uniref:LOW QUALITY PROTEIN: taperin n=1 Tax=Hippoglossus stenolepis TaxID=195615 RepID=UPI001FAF085B|nr:LOW QUALITY PROTEIN: taperin [Hippoglossus stenolepis]
MSGGGDVRVLRQEAGQESPRMPAWKREILERRKAKGGGSGGAGAAETSPGGGAGPQRVNGEVTGSVNGGGGGAGGEGAQRDGGPSGGSGRNYTITTASQHFAGNNKETRPAAEETPPPREESLVLQESLGPLEENPFIKLEKERRRRQDRDNAARPVQHILELYGSVPGIRTIRADNIIIIESDPDYFPEAGALKSGSKWQQNGVSSYSSLNDLLDQRGSAVTEIRAKEVVIYDTTLSRSEENLSTLGRPDHVTPLYDSGEGPGRVSRMLQKFDSNYGKLQKKSHSTENLLELDCGAGCRPRLWAKPQPDLVPKPRPGSPGSSHPSSPVFQSPCSSKPKPQPAAFEPGSPQRSTLSPQSVSSFRHRFEDTGGRGVASRDEPDRGATKVTRERDWEATEVSPQPKVPCSPETRRARAESPSSPISSKVARSTPDFEIRPSPKPDLNRIPDGDTQARALANLRLQSRNSFTVIPKRRLAALSATSSPVPSGPAKSSPSHRMAEVPVVPTSNAITPSQTPSNRKEEKELDEEVEMVDSSSKPEPPPTVATRPASPPPSEPLSPSPDLTPAPSSPPALSSPPSSSAVPSSPPFTPPPHLPSPQTLFPPLFSSAPSPAPEQPLMDQLPVTNIDDIEVEPSQRAPEPSPLVQRRKGNTFTVVPKHRADVQAQPSSPEPPQEGSTEAPPGSTPPQAPYAQLGSLLKKRYPAVEEIEVIGGYQSLAKSCLSKTSSTGKKLKISFNESSLQSTYEYPSENTAWDSGDEDEDEKVADEQPSMVGRIHIPRPSFTNSPTHSTNSNDLSSYIPKHSVDFSAWQEHKHDDGVYQEDAASTQTQMTEEVMLTPADSSSLSDYSSEPALYF